jgi:hypothetical protein
MKSPQKKKILNFPFTYQFSNEMNMKIAITHVGSNEWFNYKSEIIYGLYHTLRRLGYDVEINHNNFSENCHNLIIGADWLANNSMSGKLVKSKISYSIYEVEAYDGITINHRENFDNLAYQELIDHSEFVITPYKYNLMSYSKAGFSGKTVYCPWGFYDELIDPNLTRIMEKKFDAIFFGMLKGDRKIKIEKWRDDFKIKHVGPGEPFSMRSYFINSARYALSLSYGSSEHFINPFRIIYLLSNGVDVLSDSLEDDDGYLNGVRIFDEINFKDIISANPRFSNHLLEIVRDKKLIDSLGLVFN